MLNFLESDEAVPDRIEGEHLMTRDNLSLAQDHAARNQRNPHLVAIEKKWRTFEKEVEVSLCVINIFHFETLQGDLL